MKNRIRSFSLKVCATALLTTLSSNGAIMFSEDFESDLNRWTGQSGGAHHGVIVPDPLATGRNNVLAFTALNLGGDIFTTNRFTVSGTLALSFDYLGLRCTNTLNGPVGGFFGTSDDGLYISNVPDCSWKSGTSDAYPPNPPCPNFVPLAYDGTWHHYTVIFSGAEAGSFHLAFEENDGRPTTSAGEAFFDNIELRTVPADPAALAIGTYAGIQITGTTGAVYRVEFSTDMPATIWTAITNIVLPASPYLFFDAQPINATGQKFYRVVAVE